MRASSRSRALLFIVGLALAAGASSAYVACGGETTDASGPADGSTADATTGDGGASGADSGPGADAGADTGIPPAGDSGPPDPGTVTCGAATCSTSTQQCCFNPQDAGASQCAPVGDGGCSPGTFSQTCNEAADCAGGNVCCLSASLGIPPDIKAACETSCSGFSLQLCKTSAECKNGQPCGAFPCRGYIIDSCGPPPMILCQ